MGLTPTREFVSSRCVKAAALIAGRDNWSSRRERANPAERAERPPARAVARRQPFGSTMTVTSGVMPA